MLGPGPKREANCARRVRFGERRVRVLAALSLFITAAITIAERAGAALHHFQEQLAAAPAEAPHRALSLFLRPLQNSPRLINGAGIHIYFLEVALPCVLQLIQFERI